MIWLLACATGGSDSADTCTDAPLVTWDSWGHGFMAEECQPCHASTSTTRNEIGRAHV